MFIVQHKIDSLSIFSTNINLGTKVLYSVRPQIDELCFVMGIKARRDSIWKLIGFDTCNFSLTYSYRYRYGEYVFEFKVNMFYMFYFAKK